MGDHYETSYVKPGRDGRKPRLCVTYHDEVGRRHERTRAAEPKRLSALRREAEEWRVRLNREWEEERERREREEEESRTPTLSEYLRDYIGDRLAEGLEPSTVLTYMRDASLVLDPEGGLAELRLGGVGTVEVRRWMRSMLGVRGLSPRSVSRAMTFLRQALRRAAQDRIAPMDEGVSTMQGPRVQRKRPNALDRESVSTLRRWVAEDCDWFRTVVAIALYTGMRRGEVCALRWRDVDFEGHIIHVRHAIGTGADGTYLKGPKSGETRRFGIPVELERLLLRRRERAISELTRLYDGEVAQSRLGGIYVCGKVDGTWRAPNLVSVHWRLVRRRLGIRGLERERCPFHDLRHTFITYMLLAGTPVRTVSGIVGHSSAAMTLDVYASEDMDDMVRAASTVGSALPCDVPDDDDPVYELPEGDDPMAPSGGE